MTADKLTICERLEESAKAFRENSVFTSDGDEVRLGVQADEATEAVAVIRDLVGALEDAESAIQSAYRQADAEHNMTTGLVRDPEATRLVEALQRISALRPSHANADTAMDLHLTVKAIADSALAAAPSPEATRTELVADGFDKAVAAIRLWKGHGLSASTDERLEAVAHDLETNKATILSREQSGEGSK